MQAQNQRETGAKAVKPLLRGGSRHINRTYQQYTFFGESQIRYVSVGTSLKFSHPQGNTPLPQERVEREAIGEHWKGQRPACHKMLHNERQVTKGGLTDCVGDAQTTSKQKVRATKPPACPKGVLQRLKVKNSHPRSSHLKSAIQEIAIQKQRSKIGYSRSSHLCIA